MRKYSGRTQTYSIRHLLRFCGNIRVGIPLAKTSVFYKMVVLLSVCSAGEKPTPLVSIKFAKNIYEMGQSCFRK